MRAPSHFHTAFNLKTATALGLALSPTLVARADEVIEGRFKMKLPPPKFLHLAAGAAALPAVSRVARAQTYPWRPVTIIVRVPPGGVADPIARILADHLTVTLGQSVVVGM